MDFVYQLIGKAGFGALIGWFAGCGFMYLMMWRLRNHYYQEGQEQMRERAAKVAYDRAKQRENPKNTADHICALEVLDR